MVCRTMFAIKKLMGKPYGVSKVSLLWSPIDMQHCPYSCCLPLPVAMLLNIERDVAY